MAQADKLEQAKCHVQEGGFFYYMHRELPYFSGHKTHRIIRCTGIKGASKQSMKGLENFSRENKVPYYYAFRVPYMLVF